jgi:hypothetical protein
MNRFGQWNCMIFIQLMCSLHIDLQSSSTTISIKIFIRCQWTQMLSRHNVELVFIMFLTRSWKRHGTCKGNEHRPYDIDWLQLLSINDYRWSMFGHCSPICCRVQVSLVIDRFCFQLMFGMFDELEHSCRCYQQTRDVGKKQKNRLDVVFVSLAEWFKTGLSVDTTKHIDMWTHTNDSFEGSLPTLSRELSSSMDLKRIGNIRSREFIDVSLFTVQLRWKRNLSYE